MGVVWVLLGVGILRLDVDVQAAALVPTMQRNGVERTSRTCSTKNCTSGPREP